MYKEILDFDMATVSTTLAKWSKPGLKKKCVIWLGTSFLTIFFAQSTISPLGLSLLRKSLKCLIDADCSRASLYMLHDS